MLSSTIGESQPAAPSATAGRILRASTFSDSGVILGLGTPVLLPSEDCNMLRWRDDSLSVGFTGNDASSPGGVILAFFIGTSGDKP